MNLKCLFGHQWNDSCMCERCGEIRNEWHKWMLVEGKCNEKCSICGKERSIAHKWDGCKCERCGETQDRGHKWVLVESESKEKCSICGKEHNESAMYVFVTLSNNALGMLTFGNTEYYSEEYCISKVRANFGLSLDFPVHYIPQKLWGGPKPQQNGNSFTIDLPLVNALQLKYLVEKYNIDKNDAMRGIQQAQVMQVPNLGMLWLCVKLS